MAQDAIHRLCEAIGYPERVAPGVFSHILQVDGAEIRAEERGGRIRLSLALTDDADALPALARYAAGRMLREDAVLAYAGAGAAREAGAFLWQDAPASAGARELVRLFGTFADACDWWRARVEGLRGETGARAEIPPLMIRP